MLLPAPHAPLNKIAPGMQAPRGGGCYIIPIYTRPSRDDLERSHLNVDECGISRACSDMPAPL